MSNDDSVHIPRLAGRAARLAPASMQPAMARHAANDMAALSASPSAPVEGTSIAPARPKIGAEHAKSMLKLGFHELTQALVALPDTTIRPIEEPGVFGNEHMPHLRGHAQAVDPPQEPERDLTPSP